MISPSNSSVVSADRHRPQWQLAFLDDLQAMLGLGSGDPLDIDERVFTGVRRLVGF